MAVRSAKPGIGGICRVAGRRANTFRFQPLRGRWAGISVAAMTEPAPAAPENPARYTAEQYFALVDQGVLEHDDKVELLEGVVVAMAPENLWHASGVRLVFETLRAAVGRRAYVDQQHCFVAGPLSVPEPDVA